MQYAEEDITLYRRTNDAFALRKGGAAHISDGSKASFGKSVSHFRSSLNKRTFAEPARSSHQGQNRNSARQSRGEAARRACYASPSRTACCSRHRAACSDSFMRLAMASTAESSAAH